MIMEVLNTVLGIANAVSIVSESLGSNSSSDNRPVEVIEKEVVRENPVQQQSPISLTINVNVYKDGKRSSSTIGSSNQIMEKEAPLFISQHDDCIDLDLN